MDVTRFVVIALLAVIAFRSTPTISTSAADDARIAPLACACSRPTTDGAWTTHLGPMTRVRFSPAADGGFAARPVDRAPDASPDDVRLVLARVTGPGSAIPGKKVGAEGMGVGMKPPEQLRLNLEGRDIVTIFSTGEVQLAEDLTIDEASRDFWRKIGELAPSFCHTQQTAR